jgi:hypothetical protein
MQNIITCLIKNKIFIRNKGNFEDNTRRMIVRIDPNITQSQTKAQFNTKRKTFKNILVKRSEYGGLASPNVTKLTSANNKNNILLQELSPALTLDTEENNNNERSFTDMSGISPIELSNKKPLSSTSLLSSTPPTQPISLGHSSHHRLTMPLNNMNNIPLGGGRCSRKRTHKRKGTRRA